jgi:large subunit ribosomal protein L24
MRINKCHIKKNDKVKIIAGKDKGKIGKVLKVVAKSSRLIVENINIVKRHAKANMNNNRQGGITEKEAPIHWSNIMLICNKCVVPSRIRIRQLDNGTKKRICTKCNEIIDA